MNDLSCRIYMTSLRPSRPSAKLLSFLRYLPIDGIRIKKYDRLSPHPSFFAFALYNPSRCFFFQPLTHPKLATPTCMSLSTYRVMLRLSHNAVSVPLPLFPHTEVIGFAGPCLISKTLIWSAGNLIPFWGLLST